MCKIIHGFSPVAFNTFFERFHNLHTTGHISKLHKRRVHTELHHLFFTERIINIWNTLDEETADVNSVNSFKGKLQKMYKDGSLTRLVKSA